MCLQLEVRKVHHSTLWSHRTGVADRTGTEPESALLLLIGVVVDNGKHIEIIAYVYTLRYFKLNSDSRWNNIIMFSWDSDLLVGFFVNPSFIFRACRSSKVEKK